MLYLIKSRHKNYKKLDTPISGIFDFFIRNTAIYFPEPIEYMLTRELNAEIFYVLI